MDLLFALAGLALAALAAGGLRGRGNPQEVLFFTAASMAALLVPEGFREPGLGRGAAGFVACVCLLALVSQLRGGSGAPRPTLHALRVLALVYLIGMFGATAAGAWPAPAAPQPETPAVSQEWLQAFWAKHAADGHTHEPGTAPHAHTSGVGHGHTYGVEHGHSHDDEPPPELVPIVEYTPPPTKGPHGGVLTRLSTRSEPDAGFAELRLANDAGALDVWLFRDERLVATLDLPATTTVRLRLLEGEGNGEIALAPAPATAAIEQGHFFVFRPKTRAEGRPLTPTALPALCRLEVLAGDAIYVSDDFELTSAR